MAQSGALFEPAILTANIDLETAQTDAVRWGAVPEWVLAGLAIAAAALSIALSVASRRRPADPNTPTSAKNEMVTS